MKNLSLEYVWWQLFVLLIKVLIFWATRYMSRYATHSQRSEKNPHWTEQFYTYATCIGSAFIGAALLFGGLGSINQFSVMFLFMSVAAIMGAYDGFSSDSPKPPAVKNDRDL